MYLRTSPRQQYGPNEGLNKWAIVLKEWKLQNGQITLKFSTETNFDIGIMKTVLRVLDNRVERSEGCIVLK